MQSSYFDDACVRNTALRSDKVEAYDEKLKEPKPGQGVSDRAALLGQASAFPLQSDLAGVLWAAGGDLRLTCVSPYVEQLLGYSPEEAMDGDPRRLLTAASFEAVKTALVLGADANVADAEAGGLLGPLELDLELERKDGSTVRTHNRVMALGMPGGARLAGVVGLSHESYNHYRAKPAGWDCIALGYLLGIQAASGRMRMDETLTQSKVLDERSLHGLPCPAMPMEDEGQVLPAGRPARRAGGGFEELWLRALERYDPGRSQAAGTEAGTASPAGRVAPAQQPVNENVGVPGRSRGASRTPAEDDVMLQFAFNITGGGQVEEAARQGNAELNKRIDLVRALVHELKTPLTSVIASGELLAAELPEGPLLRLTRNLNRGAYNLNNRIDELLDLAKGELGMLELKLRPVDVARLLREAVTDMMPAASTNGQEITVDAPSSLPYVLADEERLRRVLVNLINNACKWTPNGESIVVSASTDGASILVHVRDRGPGIKDQELERVFEPYYRAEHDSQYISGLGLGLALCKILVELHGGRIWAESRTGEGSTFSFSLPLEAVQ